MTRLLFRLAPLACAVATGCSTSTPASPTRASTTSGGDIEMALTQSRGAEASQGTFTELTAYNDRICELVFPGTPSQTAEFFAIWNLGHAILDEPFDTSRPDLYAVLPGTMHQVPGSPELDHDHIVSHAPGDPRVQRHLGCLGCRTRFQVRCRDLPAASEHRRDVRADQRWGAFRTGRLCRSRVWPRPRAPRAARLSLTRAGVSILAGKELVDESAG